MPVGGVVKEEAFGCFAVDVKLRPLEWLRQCHDATAPPGPPTPCDSTPGSALMVLAQDWRRGVLESADRLVQTLTKVSTPDGANPIVISHSIGRPGDSDGDAHSSYWRRR